MPGPSSRRVGADSQAQGRSIESFLAWLSKERDNDPLPLSLIQRVRSATLTNISEWRPKVYPYLPAFPSPDLLSLPNMSRVALGGSVYTEETESGYWPVEQRVTIDSMWDGRPPESIVSSARNRLYL